MDLTWDTFKALSPKEKTPLLVDTDGSIQRLVYAQQYSRTILDRVMNLADVIRRSDVRQLRQIRSLLATKSCVLYFPQCSTRTFTSFSLAAQSVGMMVEEIRDPELSAMYKGESELDTLLTLATLSDLVVLRQMNSELTDRFVYELLKRGMATRVINGGSGSDQHPTQGLLELYTLRSYLDIACAERAISIAFVGDLSRSRTARSLSYLLALYPHVKQIFVAPTQLQMGRDLLEYLDRAAIRYSMTESLDDVIPIADAFYLMRIQDEYSVTSDTLRDQYRRYHLSVDSLARMKPDACIIHPLPRRDELPIEIDFDPRAKYWEAVLGGKYVRIALLMHMFGCAEHVSLSAPAVEPAQASAPA